MQGIKELILETAYLMINRNLAKKQLTFLFLSMSVNLIKMISTFSVHILLWLRIQVSSRTYRSWLWMFIRCYISYICNWKGTTEFHPKKLPQTIKDWIILCIYQMCNFKNKCVMWWYYILQFAYTLFIFG